MPKSKKKRCSFPKRALGLKSQHLADVYSTIPSDEDLKNGHVLHIFFEHGKSVSETLRFLSHFSCIDDNIKFYHIQRIVKKYEAFKKLTRESQRKAFMNFCSKKFTSDLGRHSCSEPGATSMPRSSQANLESEVSSLKKRLDGLRKAKNTTVLKKEKEYVSVGASDSNRTSKRPSISEDKSSELQKKLKDLSLQHADEISALKKKHDTDLKKLKSEKTKPATPEKCNHEEEILQLKGEINELKEKNAKLEHVNSTLKEENVSLHAKFEELFTELSLKEAQWCEKEEQLNLKLKLQWGEKYREWMEATEKKIAELQRANDYLRTCLKSPSGD